MLLTEDWAEALSRHIPEGHPRGQSVIQKAVERISQEGEAARSRSTHPTAPRGEDTAQQKSLQEVRESMRHQAAWPARPHHRGKLLGAAQEG